MRSRMLTGKVGREGAGVGGAANTQLEGTCTAVPCYLGGKQQQSMQATYQCADVLENCGVQAQGEGG